METKELTPEEKWKQATIDNNFIDVGKCFSYVKTTESRPGAKRALTSRIFYKVMHDNPDVCQHLLEILLEIEIDKIEINTQEVIDIDWQSKGIRLDVYAKNSNQVFDIEMQSTDTLELPERARYYQGAMDCAVRASEHM